MKKINLFLFAIGIVTLLFSGSNSFGAGYSTAAMSWDTAGSSQSAQGSPYAFPDQSTLNQEYRDYVLGLKGPENLCMVQKFTASNPNEAMIFARTFCPTCTEIKDITGKRTTAEAPWEAMIPEEEVFCSK